MADRNHGGFDFSFKAERMLARYYGRRSLKTAATKLPYALFATSFMLFAIVLLPSLRLRIRDSALLSGLPQRIQLQGSVTEVFKDSKGNRIERPFEGITVEVGAIKTRTSADGKYQLLVDVFGDHSLPIILSTQTQSTVRRISIPEHAKIAVNDFELSR